MLLLLACANPVADPCAEPGAARSTCLTPTRSEAYYADQSLAYFDTLESDYDGESGPTYGPGVARWEWPPWLLLTGYGREDLEAADALIRLLPTSVPVRDCVAVDVQPFGRCVVEFVYPDFSELPCPIYEEFTFNDAGEITFIEAWSDLPGITPVTAADPWAEREGAPRLSTRIPGLGSPSGAIDLDSPWMAEAAAADPDVADFVARARDFYGSWLEAYLAAGDDVFATGCGW